MKACLQSNQCTVPENTTLLQDSTNSMRNLHLISYIALYSEMYISIRQLELQRCKKTGYKFYCEELFVVKHKTKYSCESDIF